MKNVLLNCREKCSTCKYGKRSQKIPWFLRRISNFEGPFKINYSQVSIALKETEILQRVPDIPQDNKHILCCVEKTDEASKRNSRSEVETTILHFPIGVFPRLVTDTGAEPEATLPGDQLVALGGTRQSASFEGMREKDGG